MSDTTTDGIRIVVETKYVAERSAPEANAYFFAYQVKLSNLGDTPARLVARYWKITDGAGQVHEVEGPGVIGNQPRLEPGDHFQYVSACPLKTPVGTMEGYYTMQRDDDDSFEAIIAPFTLAMPYALN